MTFVNNVVLIGFVGTVYANMYDVLEPLKLPPIECKHGCAPWSTAPAKLWKDKKVLANASNHCAQPGAAVNEHVYGSWCYCASPPLGPLRAETPIGHGTFSLENEGTGPSDPAHGMWVSFTGMDMLLYDETANATGDAGVWQLVPVDENTDQFYFKNLWHGPAESRYGDWMAFSGTTMELVDSDDIANRVPWRAVPVAGAPPYTYHLQNVWHNSSGDARAGMWAGADGTSMQLTPNDGKWAHRGTYRFYPVAPPRASGYCVSAHGVPEQINLQIAAPGATVVSFVTFEETPPVQPPTATLSTGSTGNTRGTASEEASNGFDGSQLQTFQGVTHVHRTSGGRVYYMHFVRLHGLAPRARYHYAVRSGGQGAQTSEVLSFRAPYADGVTKLAIFGDMGIYEWNNLEWLYKDCTAAHGEEDAAADIIVHLGDHAYNEVRSAAAAIVLAAPTGSIPPPPLSPPVYHRATTTSVGPMAT